MENNKTEKFKDESIIKSKDVTVEKSNSVDKTDIDGMVDRKKRIRNRMLSMDLEKIIRTELNEIILRKCKDESDESIYERVEREIIEKFWIESGQNIEFVDGEFRTELHRYIDDFISIDKKGKKSEHMKNRRNLMKLGRLGTHFNDIQRS